MNNLITIKNISVIFSNRSILKDISLTFQQGKIFTIVGLNGAGKSTLIKVILGLIIPNKGTIFINRKIKIGYVPQKIYINYAIPLTVYNFISLKSGTRKSEILYFLDRIEALYLFKLPMYKLSGGEIQRVLITRALLNKPNLLILDEPTQGLDENGKKKLYNLMNDIRNTTGCTIIVVSHDTNFIVERTDYIFFLHNKIIFSGTTDIVLSNPNFINIFGKIS